MTDLIPKLCNNCSGEMQAKFCGQCGQKDKEYQPHLKEWLLVIWDDFVSVDAKLLNTLKALFKPGVYSSDWLAGKQQRYVHPVRFYIFLSIIFSVLNYLGINDDSFITIVVHGLTDYYVEKEANSNYYSQIIQLVTLLMLPLSIISAQIYDRNSIMIKSIFFVVTVYSALMLLLILQMSMNQIFEGSNIGRFFGYLFLLVSTLFTILSARKVYQIGYFNAFFKTILWMLFNMVLIFSVTAVAQGFFAAHESVSIG